MRLQDKLIIKRETSVPDGFGGKILSPSSSSIASATVSISNNELKPLSNGLGFYRKITFITDLDADIVIKDVAQYNNIEYSIEKITLLKDRMFKCYTGYEK